MEDARFVRFVDDDGSVTYYATYTAYSGSHISQQLLETTDFQSFTSSADGRSRRGQQGPGTVSPPDRRPLRGHVEIGPRVEHRSPTPTSVACGRTRVPCQRPTEAWEVLQLGNCGPPIETDAGWLVLTHGVGPMRTYSIGAILLDLDDPTRVLGRLRQPLLSPAPDEQDGYVPNVVYSCGALVHADTLVMPYGIGDAAIGIATVPLPRLLAALGA